VKRREFIMLRGGAAAAWPLAARAQQGERMRRIGILMNLAADDPEGQARITAFAQGLQETGWIVGRNVRIDYRWGAGNPDRMRKYAAELVALAPDVIVAATSLSVGALQQVTRTIPIVFAQLIDPVGSGFVASLPRPGGNVTGFIHMEDSMVGKWLELLKEIAPRVNRVAFLFNPATAPFAEYFLNPFKAAARSFALEIRDGIAGRTSTSVGFATTNYGLACSGVMSWGRQLRRSAMSDAVALVWTATILAYAVIAVAFILGRWAFNRIRQVLEHEGALQMAKTKSSACR
jgi:ABC-type uncharacterized transport system substrate-binding protein